MQVLRLWDLGRAVSSPQIHYHWYQSTTAHLEVSNDLPYCRLRSADKRDTQRPIDPFLGDPIDVHTPKDCHHLQPELFVWLPRLLNCIRYASNNQPNPDVKGN